MSPPPTLTKIVATVGPASGDLQTIRRLIDAGVDVFRLNFSHGDHDTHAEYIAGIRRAAGEAGVEVGILQDLQGPRIRTGRLRGGEPVYLADGADVVLRPGEFEGDATQVPVGYADFAADVAVGDRVLLSDGSIELTVLESDGARALCRVNAGGMLGERKGINLPATRLSISAPTEKDVEDLRFGLEHDVDYVALSFVVGAADVTRLREEMERIRPGAPVSVVAKIERPAAVENLREILLGADAVMVARGDLGIEMPPEAVPAVQKKIIRLANGLAVPVITATQMLESMVHAVRPTRAETSDVANAMLDGTDAVMLSAETSVGEHPVQAALMMDRIARRMEEMCRQEGGRPAGPTIEGEAGSLQHAMARAACDIAEDLSAAGIVAFTMTGSTARYLSQRRPAPPVYALTPDVRTCRRLALVRGVRPVVVEEFATTDEMIRNGQERLLELGLAHGGDVFVYVAGASTLTPGGTDLLKVHRFPS